MCQRNRVIITKRVYGVHKKSKEQTDFTKMRIYLTNSNGLNRKVEGNESELSKVERILSTLL